MSRRGTATKNTVDLQNCLRFRSNPDTRGRGDVFVYLQQNGLHPTLNLEVIYDLNSQPSFFARRTGSAEQHSHGFVFVRLLPQFLLYMSCSPPISRFITAALQLGLR